MKIGFASRWDPLDKKSWSGTGYYTYREICKYGNTEIFHYKWPWYIREWFTTQKSINRRFLKKHTSVEYLHLYARYFSRQLEKDLQKRPVDILFVPSSPQLIAYADIKVPVIYMSDATFELLGGYYNYFSGLTPYNIRQGIALDKLAIEKATHCMMASDWAADFVVNQYHKKREHVSVAPLGANLDEPPLLQRRFLNNQQSYRLLFLAVEWERKGGEIALETFSLLKQMGINVTLHIVGCIPPHNLSDEKDITVIPFLNKNNKEDFAQLNTLLLQTDFLLLPTRAECAGIVYCEAAAYGIPSITTDTGGVTTYVKNDVNGYTLPLSADAATFADCILSVLKTPGKKESLSQSSRKRFEEKLNWECWGSELNIIIKKLTNKPFY